MNQFTNTFTTDLQRTAFDGLDLSRMTVNGQQTITEEEIPDRIDNPALATIAQDVLDAAKLSFTAALEAPGGALEGSAESAVAVAYLDQAKKSGRADEIRKTASTLLDADRKSMVAVFGRALTETDGTTVTSGKVRDVLSKFDGGVARAVDRMSFDVDTRHLGIRPPALDIRLNTPGLRMDGGNLIVPGSALGAQFENAGDFESVHDDVVNANAEGLRDGVFDRDLFETMWGQTLDDDLEGSDDFEAVTDRLRLTLLRLHCVDETGGSFAERFGNDEMAIAGIATDETGDTSRISERFIGSGFRDGRSRTMNWTYQNFNLNEGAGFPKSYGVTFLLAEKDNGGLSSALQRAWQAIRGAVQSAIAKAAAKAGVAIATFLTIPAAGAIIGKAIAVAVNWILDRFVGWIIRLFADDIFRPQTTRMTIPSLSARWRYANGQWGSPHSPVLRRRFSGHDGMYDLYFRWSLMA